MGIQFVKDNFPVPSPLDKMAEQASKGFCPFCNKEVSPDDFRNEISKKEFKISGICQKCQDDFFGRD